MYTKTGRVSAMNVMLPNEECVKVVKIPVPSVSGHIPKTLGCLFAYQYQLN